MIKKYITLGEVCEKGSSTIMQKDLSLGNGPYQIYGASGLLGTVDFYKQEKEYIGIVKDGAGVGRAMLLPEKSSCIGTMQYLIPRENINVRFLFYAIESMNLAKYNTGATIPHIYFKDYKKEVLPLFDIQEQQEIAHQFDKIKSLISYRQSQLKYFDDLVKSQFIEMFEHRDIATIKIGSVLETTSGGTPSKSNMEYYENGEIPWMTSGEVSQGLIFDVKNRITEKGLKNSSAKWMPQDTVVVAMYGATAGQVGLLKIKTTTNQAVCGILPNGRFNALYLYHAVSRKKEWMISQCAGGAQPNISQTVIKRMEILEPPIDDQEQFAAFVEQTDKSKIPFEMEVAA